MRHPWRYFTPNDGYAPGLNIDRAMSDAAFDKKLAHLEDLRDRYPLTSKPRLNDAQYNVWRDEQELQRVKRALKGH